MFVRMQGVDSDLDAEIAVLRVDRLNIGAMVSFIGTVCDINDGAGISEMELEHYPGMIEKVLADVVSAAMQRWKLIDALVIHRVDRPKPQDQIVLVAVVSKHRDEPLTAYEFIMDYLRSKVSFWRKEQTPEDVRRADACVTDDKALTCWGIASNNATSSTASQSDTSVQPNDYG